MHPRRSAAAVLAMVLLAACGDSDPEAASPSDAVPATTTVTTVIAATAQSAAAGPAPTSPIATDPMASDPTAARATAAAPPTTPPGQPATTTPAPSVALAAWQTMPITDVDGVTFTLGDLVGKPVLVETFATWCSKCRAQLGDTNTAAAQIGDAAHVVALSVETDLDASTVADYAVDAGFDRIRFAVMSPELLAAMVEAFGTTVANPPTTPKIVVDAAGRAGELTTGFESPDELVAQVAAAG